MDVRLASILVGLLILVLGLVLLKWPPKDPNNLWGFRTIRASKTKRNWDMAQEKTGKMFLALGSLCLVFSLALRLASAGDKSYEWLIIGITIIIILASVYINMSLPDK